MNKFGYAFMAFFPLIELIASIVLMIAGIVLMVSSAMGGTDMSAAVPSILLWVGIAGIIVGIVLCIMGIAVFTVHAKNNSNLEGNGKGIWIGLFVTLICFVFPVYWWKYIRKS